MAYYNICPNCGSNLDPGETCDCERESQPEEVERKGGEFFWRRHYGNRQSIISERR